MTPPVLDVNKQLVFYGAYHANRTNVLIHMLCVPLLIWSAQVMLATLPTPAFFPSYNHEFNKYLAFDFNLTAIMTAGYLTYYYLLLPSAALLYTPQMILSMLTATAFAQSKDHIKIAGGLHAVCWIAQFLGHGVWEGRAPALLDNLLGAVVLAPFFVHLEMLFDLGYYPTLHKAIQNGVGKEIVRIRSEAAKMKRKEL